MEISLINSQDQAYAEGRLAQYYENGMIPAEKKAYLTELSQNAGPFMGIETGTNETHYLLDAASQIATLGLGFSPSVFMGTTHLLSTWSNDDQDPVFLKLKGAFHSFLQRQTGWKNMDMTICNSGAESNEIALGYAFKRRKNKKAKKVLAFEGSFHGRMLISLYSTWNKSKREPFTWEGYETQFTDFPELPGNEINQNYPENWRTVWDHAPHKDFIAPNPGKDQVLQKEIDSLIKVKENLSLNETFAIIVEPMQCEGGDRYASDRFFTALLIMAKAYGVEVIFDEVQTGFHLGREFFWHRHFCLTDQHGDQLNPDYLVCAKKAQVGLVLSPHDLKRRGIEAREQYQVASVARGYIHGVALQQSRTSILKLEELIKQRLNNFIKKHSAHLDRPRALGMSFAFDLKNQDKVNDYINKRFEHGLLYYPAGSHTLRFRLNTSYTVKDIDFLFERLEEITNTIFNDHQSNFNGKASTIERSQSLSNSFHTLLLKARVAQIKGENLDDQHALNEVNKLFKLYYEKETDISFELITKKNFPSFREDIQALQKEIYEPARQTSLERFEICANSPFGICLGVIKSGSLKGMLFSSSLNDHPLERGVRQDKDFNDPKSLYVIDTTVSNELQGLGLGKFLKYTQALIAISREYNYIKGRNRDQLASKMLNINLSLGSYEQMYLREDYPDFEQFRDVIYYRTPLNWKTIVNLGNRQNSLLTAEDLSHEFIEQQIPYLTNKVCLSNFVSENFLKHVKAIVEQAPVELRHAYTASGQSECVDKVFKSIIYNGKEQFRPKSKLGTFKGHFFGRGSFLSRSLSGDKGHDFFPVKTFDHPTNDNYEEVLDDIKKAAKQGKLNSLWIEPVCQDNYSNVPLSFLKKLRKLADSYSIPLIYNETASQQFTYSDNHYFMSHEKEIMPDCFFAFLGGQAGLVFCKEQFFVAKPLMMISTWDGDEHAFASYHKGMDDILKNKEDYIKTRNEFHTKMVEKLSEYPNSTHNLKNGRGIVKGPLPTKILKKFRKLGSSFICDPSYRAMKVFLKNA